MLILYNLTLAITTKILVRFLLKINELIKIQMTFLASGNSGVFCHSNPAYNINSGLSIYTCAYAHCVCVCTDIPRQTYTVYSHLW